MDQCKHCTVRGDRAKCQQTPCNYRETWWAQEVTAMNEELLEALERLEQTAGIALFHTDPYRVDARAAIAKARGQNEV